MGLACHRSRPPGARQAAFLCGVRIFAWRARSYGLSAGVKDMREEAVPARHPPHHSILMPASVMIFAYFATSAFINAVTSSGFEMKASDPCLTR